MHILVTRPEEDADALRRPLEALGHRVSLAPMMEIELLPVPSHVIEGASALIATSRNGLRALARSNAAFAMALKVPVFTVGPATTALARDLGFQTIFEGPGTAAELEDIIERDVNPTHGAIVHLAGKQVAVDLASALRGRGYTVFAPGVYRSIPVQTLPPEVASDLKAGAIDAVVLMSPKSAEAYVTQAAPLFVSTKIRQPAYLCLSDAVADRLGPLFPDRIFIAIRPNLEEIVILASRLTA